MHALHARHIDRYFVGALRPAAVAQMYQRLWGCGRCRVRYERHLLHERTVPDGDARQQDRLWRSILASAGVDARDPDPLARAVSRVHGRMSRP